MRPKATVQSSRVGRVTQRYPGELQGGGPSLRRLVEFEKIGGFKSWRLLFTEELPGFIQSESQVLDVDLRNLVCKPEPGNG